MNGYEIVTVLISASGVILIPILVLMVRTAMRWTRTEDKLTAVVENLERMLTESDKVHNAMYSQMANDRDVTDKRLRFIEEWFMRRGSDNAIR